MIERPLSYIFELVGQSDTLESRTVLESVKVDSSEVFVPDDAFEGEALDEHNLFDDRELIRESDTREGAAVSECSHS